MGHWSPGRERYAARWPDRERVKAEGLAFYGVEFTRDVRNFLEAAIRAGRSRPVERVGTMRVVHDVDLPGVGRVRVIYSSRRSELVAVLPVGER